MAVAAADYCFAWAEKQLEKAVALALAARQVLFLQQRAVVQQYLASLDSLRSCQMEWTQFVACLRHLYYWQQLNLQGPEALTT